MTYEQTKIQSIKESIEKMQLELAYYEAIETITSIIDTVEIVPNGYLIGEVMQPTGLSFRWDWCSTVATEKSVLDTIARKVKCIKEHYTQSNLDWVKPLKKATKDFFAYRNK